MKFAPLELCKKLVELGCESESEHLWVPGHFHPTMDYSDCAPEDLPEGSSPSFTQNDFTGCHEQARENAKLVWGTFLKKGREFWDHPIMTFEWSRRKMIDSDDWIKFLEESIKDTYQKHCLDKLTKEPQEENLKYNA